MNYQVIARRYRPRRFEEVVGQEAVAETLRSGILQERIAHAYLFTGPRGVGKTSMARIFAKALNCPRAADRTRARDEWARPCDECSICETIHVGQDIDVIEMDGASNRGIEDIRSLVEGVNRPATRSRYKVFIIDEVHMLTREAFNALLKTLEEPPAHVKFVFATTEAHRIPDTVVSRCQRFDFHPIQEEAIVRRLEQILEGEGRQAESGLLLKIARYGKGGLRDAQTLLDQLMTFAEGELRSADLDKLTGRVAEETLGALAEATLHNEPAAVLDRVRGCFACGADPALLLEQMIEEYRTRLHALVRGAGGGAAAGAPSPSIDRLLGALQILVDAAGRLRTSAFAELAVELVLLKITRLEEPASVEEAIRLLRAAELHGGEPPARGPSSAGTRGGGGSLGATAEGPAHARGGQPSPGSFTAALRANVEDRARSAPAVAAVRESARAAGGAADSLVDEPSPPTGAEGARTSAATAVAPAPARAACDYQRLRLVWEQLRIELEKKHPDVAPFFKEVQPERAEGADDVIVLRFDDEFFLRQMKASRRLSAFETLLREVTGAPWKARLELATPGGSRAAVTGGDGPLPRSRTEREGANGNVRGAERRDAPRVPPGQQGIANDPLVRKSLDLFNGRLV